MVKRTSASMGVLDGLIKKTESYDNKCIKSTETTNNNQIDIFNEYDNIKNLNNATTFIIKKEMGTALNQFLIAHTLKKIKDRELYKPNYDSFYDYAKNELPYQKSQIYRFVGIADAYPINETSREIIEMGMTKLQLLTSIEHDNLIGFIDKNNIVNMSVRDIKNLLRDNNTKNNEPNLNNKIDTEFVLKFQKRISLLSQNISDMVLRNENEDNSLNKIKLYNNLIKAKKDIENIINGINISEQ